MNSPEGGSSAVPECRNAISPVFLLLSFRVTKRLHHRFSFTLFRNLTKTEMRSYGRIISIDGRRTDLSTLRRAESSSDSMRAAIESERGREHNGMAGWKYRGGKLYDALSYMR